jgi:hypothetical protein
MLHSQISPNGLHSGVPHARWTKQRSANAKHTSKIASLPHARSTGPRGFSLSLSQTHRRSFASLLAHWCSTPLPAHHCMEPVVERHHTTPSNLGVIVRVQHTTVVVLGNARVPGQHRRCPLR